MKKSENFSSSSTGRGKLKDLSNQLQDELLKGVTDLCVIHYPSNGYYKPYSSQAEGELGKRKQREHRAGNIEAKRTVLVEQDRRSKRQQSNDDRSNECIICGNKTFSKDSKLYRLREAEKVELLSEQHNLIWMQSSPKCQFLINLVIYLQLIL